MRVSIAAILSTLALLCLAPMAFAQDADKDAAKPAAGQSDSDKASEEDKLPAGATAVPDDDDKGKDEKSDADKKTEDKPPEGAAEVKDGEPEGPPRQGFVKPFKKKAAEAPAEEAGQGNATGESKSGASLKDLVNDGFVIRTTVFIPAEAVTRQLGKVSGDAVVITLQKQFSTAICYYSFKAYVGGGLTKIASCTVHK